MMRRNYWLGALLIAALPISGCAKAAVEDVATKVQPATVEKIPGSDQKRVVLTEKAAERLGIQTAPVRAGSAADGDPQQRVVDYAAVIYDAQGKASVYTNPEPLIFVRQDITVDHIDGDRAFLSTGPPVGTAVVIVGAAELFGTEFGIGQFE
jgi:hypothetical protein